MISRVAIDARANLQRILPLLSDYFSELRKRRREVEDPDGAVTMRMSVLAAQQIHIDIVDLKKALGLLNDDRKVVLPLVGAEGFS